MVRHRSEWPSIEELVMCTVTKVFAQGAFVAMDEYGGKEGMVHLSEVASGWVEGVHARRHALDLLVEGEGLVP